MAYENLGLDPYLNPVNAPQNQGGADPYIFQSENDRGMITNNFVQNISADKIAAGTITVAMTLGSSATGTITIDGANNRMVWHDGTTNRIVIGEAS